MQAPGRFLQVDHSIVRATDKGALVVLGVAGAEQPGIFKIPVPEDPGARHPRHGWAPSNRQLTPPSTERGEGAQEEMMTSRLFRRALVVAVSLVLALAPSGAGAQTPWTAPEPEKNKKGPVAAGPKAVEQGKKVMQVNCAGCHGNTGEGNGPAAIALSPKPADWTSKKVQDETDGEIFWKITSGRGPMPSWRHLPEADRWALVQYIRSLKK